MRDWNLEGSIFFTIMLVGISKSINGICGPCWFGYCRYWLRDTHVIDCADPVVVVSSHVELRHDVPVGAFVHDSCIRGLLRISSAVTKMEASEGG